MKYIGAIGALRWCVLAAALLGAAVSSAGCPKATSKGRVPPPGAGGAGAEPGGAGGAPPGAGGNVGGGGQPGAGGAAGTGAGGGGRGGPPPEVDANLSMSPDGRAMNAPDTGGREAGPEAAPGADTGGGPSIHVAAAGDIAAAMDGDEATTADLLHKVHAQKPLQAILMLGDGAYRFARLAEYRRLYEPTWGVPVFKAMTYPIPGNHEYLENPSGGGYYDYWNGVGQMNGKAGERGKGYYSFDLGVWHVVALNSNEDCAHVACGEGSAQLAWLRADLAANRAFCTLAMVHAPRFQSGTHRGDTPALQPAWAAMYDAGVDVVLSAHEHNYQQFAPMDKTGQLDRARGIRSFVVGTGGGRDFRSEFNNARMATEEKRIVNQSGVMFLELDPRGYSFRWLYADGRVGATGDGVCH